jgi:hypothetical protein
LAGKDSNVKFGFFGKLWPFGKFGKKFLEK